LIAPGRLVARGRKAEPPQLLDDALERLPPAAGAIRDAVLGADLPHSGRDLAQAVGGQARKQVVLDLTIERATQERDPVRHLVVVGRLDLHAIPLGAAMRAGAR